MTISVDDVRRLLAANPEAVLVLTEGRTEIVPAADIVSPTYRGTLRVASRQEVVERAGGTKLSERQLVQEAETLDTAVRNVGS